MTSPEPEPAAGSLSRVGALRSGFYYQDLIAWSAALRVLQPSGGYNQLEIEVNGAGNVDDVILRAIAARHRYAQVKWAAKTADLINDAYLTSEDTPHTTIAASPGSRRFPMRHYFPARTFQCGSSQRRPE